MSDTTQLIKEKLEIADFLRPYMELKPAGKNFKARCPFHKEKTPSFMVSPERQSWHCFGACNEGGDIIKFLMKYENLEFYDALKILAEKADVDLGASGDRDFKSYNVLYKITEAAKDFFKINLMRSDLVNQYLRERGLKPETIQEFELGLAPDQSDVLTRHLLGLGHRISDIETAGLNLKTERGTYWDRFRSRIIFPIYNHVGKTVGFTGRILPGKESDNFGKYVNSPETPIFQKSKILYGFHKTKNDIREAKSAVLVEGQMDFLLAWQDGVKNAAATSGTALTEDHLKVLRRLADELVLAFDSDDAGQKAIERAIDLGGAQDFSVKVLLIKDSALKDPADVVQQKPGQLKILVSSASLAMEYYFKKYLAFPLKDIRLQKQAIRRVLGKIKMLASAVEQNHWLQKLSQYLGLDERVLVEEMALLPAGKEIILEPSRLENQPPPALSRRDLIIQRLFGLALYQNNLSLLTSHIQYCDSRYQDLFAELQNKSAFSSAGNLGEMMDAISLRFSFENEEIDPVKLKKETDNLIRELRVEYLKEKQQTLRGRIRELETSGDEADLAAALKEFDFISKELHNI